MRMTAAVLLLFAACTQQPAAPEASQTATPATAEPPAAAQVSGPRITFPNGYVVGVEVVADQDSRAEGLMYRDQLLPARGMIFFFPEDGVYSFWMKNTRIPLDMIWIDAEKKVVHIKSNVPPCKADPCPSYDPGVKSRYVLEVAGGEAAKRGMKTGDALRFEGMDHVVAR